MTKTSDQHSPRLEQILLVVPGMNTFSYHSPGWALLDHGWTFMLFRGTHLEREHFSLPSVGDIVAQPWVRALFTYSGCEHTCASTSCSFWVWAICLYRDASIPYPYQNVSTLCLLQGCKHCLLVLGSEHLALVMFWIFIKGAGTSPRSSIYVCIYVCTYIYRVHVNFNVYNIWLNRV